MRGQIFISYRRGDDPGYTQALFQLLQNEFGHERLFMDVEGYVKAGDDFASILDERVRNCDILLAIIGPSWIDARNDKGERRLADPNDFVRIEIASALEQGKRLIPVLVNKAAMPLAKDLPKLLRPLATRNAVRVTHERFSADCRGLVNDVREALAQVARQVPKNPSTALLAGACLFLAAAFAWVTSALLTEPSTSRVLALVFGFIAAAFLVVAALAFLRYLNPHAREPELRQQQR